MPRLADVAEWTEYAKAQELRAEAAEARVTELEAALGRLLAALTDEESEHGFPFNFEAREALAAAMRIHEKGDEAK